jgi:CRP-like cAMP-binding protein
VEERISHSLVKALRSVPDFEALDDRELLDIVGASANLFWEAGSLVFEQGSPSEGLFVVLSGSVKIVDVVDGQAHEVATVGPGSSFGELSLILDTTHSKEAVAGEDAELLVVPKESFQDLLRSNEALAAHFNRKVEARMTVPGEVQ